MFDHALRVTAMFAGMFFIMSLDSLPTWLVLASAFACVVAFIYEILLIEEDLTAPDELPKSDTPIADQVAADLAFDRDFNKEL